MITAAIYSRKSTEQDVTEEAKSVTRQIEHARAYATRKGWTVADEHIYVDDGISGAEFKKRPGLLRLLNAFDPTPPFQVLIMSEESRLGREQIETAYVLKTIMDAGAKIYGPDNVAVLGPTLGRRAAEAPAHRPEDQPGQARVVHRIFTMYAQGDGTSRIAHRLNAEGVPSPRRQGGRRGR